MVYERKGHHIINTRRDWQSYPEAASIRQTKTLIEPMERELHDEIHANCPAVPLLGFHALVHTRNAFEEGRTSLQSMENLMSAMEEAGKHPKAHPLEQKLADLAVWAIDLQRPFIAEATRSNRLRSII